MAQIIPMTKADQLRWRPILEEYYRDKGVPENQIEDIIDQVFVECQKGWERGPRDLDTRIKVKSGFQWVSHENLKPNRQKLSEEQEKPEEDDNVGDDYLYGTMTQNERIWWGKRKDIYVKDFEFNESSDKPLLEQLLVEELSQRRLFKMQLKYPDRDYSKKLTDSLKRVTEIQSKLGITREQRAGILNKIDGNVAELALSLDEKLARMPETLRLEYEEELRCINLKAQRPPINVLPPIEKVEALLQVGGKLSANLDSERISEITEAVGQELNDQREAKKEIPSKELSLGYEL